MRFKAIAATFLICLSATMSIGNPAWAKTLHLVAFGDSLMAGYQLPAEDAFPNKLAKALKAQGHDVDITNASVSGDTTADGLARVDWSIPDGTDGVILELGANDALRGIAPADTRKNLNAIISRLKDRGIAVLLAGMQAPPNMGSNYAEKFNEIYSDLAQKYDLTYYPLFVKAYVLNPDMKLGDEMHPNAKGVDAVVKAFLPVADSFLARLRSS